MSIQRALIGRRIVNGKTSWEADFTYSGIDYDKASGDDFLFSLATPQLVPLKWGTTPPLSEGQHFITFVTGGVFGGYPLLYVQRVIGGNLNVATKMEGPSGLWLVQLTKNSGKFMIDVEHGAGGSQYSWIVYNNKIGN